MRRTLAGSKYADSSSTVVVRSRHLAVRAAHHAGDGDRLRAGRDQQVVGRELAIDPVEGADRVAVSPARRTTISGRGRRS